jgi:RNA recognition motif-containing protein
MAFRNKGERGARSAPYGDSGGDDGCAVYVGNLPWDCDWKQLKDYMTEGGSVVRADVKTGEDGRSRGFGIVTFASAEDAEYAVENLNGCDMGGRELIVRADNGGKGGGEGGGRGGGGRGGGRGFDGGRGKGSKGGGKGGGKGGKGGGKGGKPKSKDALDDDLDSVRVSRQGPGACACLEGA